MLLVIAYVKIGFRNIFNFIDLIISSISWLGLFCFAYQLKLFTPIFWKDVLLAIVIWDIYYNIWVLPKSEEFNKAELVASLIMLLPLYYGLYLYAFKFLE